VPAGAGGTDRLRHRLLGADLFDHRVRAESVRELLDLGDPVGTRNPVTVVELVFLQGQGRTSSASGCAPRRSPGPGCQPRPAGPGHAGPRARPCRAPRSTAHPAISDPCRSAFAAGSVTEPDRYRAASALLVRLPPRRPLPLNDRLPRSPGRPRRQGPTRPPQGYALGHKMVSRATPGRGLLASIQSQRTSTTRATALLSVGRGTSHLKHVPIVARPPAPLLVRRPGCRRRDQGHRTGRAPAGITGRVGISCRTRIAGITLRRARRLYPCPWCPRPLPATSSTSSATVV
jgi:hypothetical protein